jgi:hypothetical protein
VSRPPRRADSRPPGGCDDRALGAARNEWGSARPRTAAGRRCWPPCANLYEICTPQADFGTRPVRATTHHVAMDVVAIVIAVAFFAAMLLLIKAIDRI